MTEDLQAEAAAFHRCQHWHTPPWLRGKVLLKYFTSQPVLYDCGEAQQYSTAARPDQPLNPTPHQLDSWI